MSGYKTLPFYIQSEIVYDFTVIFCDKYIDKRSRTHDQMVQAARSGKQNIAEGYRARASLEELLNDYQDYLRQYNLQMWEKNIVNPESACNATICLINQTNQLLDHPSSTLSTPVVYVHASWWRDCGARKLRWLEEDFVKMADFEKIYLRRGESIRKITYNRYTVYNDYNHYNHYNVYNDYNISRSPRSSTDRTSPS